MSINWGEMVWGSCKDNKKVGSWSKMTNKGFFIEGEIGKEEVKISFPFLTDDYIHGNISYNSKTYEMVIISG